MESYHILVPTDFSGCSQAALRHAVSVARIYSPARITLMHADSGSVPHFDERLGVLDWESEMAQMKLQVAEQAAKAGVSIESQAVYGAPSGKIIETATKLQVDLIVIGTHGRTGLDRLLLGSVAGAVLRRAPCPVLFVKHVVRERAPATLASDSPFERASQAVFTDKLPVVPEF